MRPLTLRVEGLRSFRQRVEIDFADRQLVAIVGDTGVGKSSLLEAITYALYSGATWTAHNTHLVADTANDMLVELTFMADGKTYTVTRSQSRTRPATARLHCHDDDNAIDNVEAVTDEVERLIGLDRATFLKSVILPQGRFAELLNATTAERNTVLRSIFRVDVLDAVGDAAKEVRDRVFPHLEGLKQRLEALPADPAGELEQAELDKADSAALFDQLMKSKATAVELEKQRVTDERRAQELADLIGELEGIDTSDVADELAAIAEREKELERERTQAQKRISDLATRLAKLRTKRERESADGLDEKTLTRAQTTLGDLVDEVTEVADAAETLAEDEAALAERQSESDIVDERAAERKRAWNRARAVSEEARKSARAAEEHLRDAEAALEKAVDAADDAAEEAAAVDDAEELLAEAEGAAAVAKEALVAATAAAGKCEHEFESVRRSNAAATAAEGTSAGDPCPVCDRELPAGFSPPEATGLDRSRQALDKANQDLKAAAEREAAAGRAFAEAKQALSDARKRRTKADGDSKKAAAALAKILGRKTVKLAESRDDLLAKLDVAREKADARASDAEAEAEEALDAMREAESAAATHRTATEAEQKRLAADRRSLDKRLERVAKKVADLPEPVRPNLGDTTSIDELDPQIFTPKRLVSVTQVVGKRLATLTKIDEEIVEAHDEQEDVDHRRAELADQLRTEVEDPRDSLASDLQHVMATFKSVSDRLGRRSPSVRITARDLSSSVAKLEAEHARLLDEVRAEVASKAADREKATAAIRDLLDEHDLNDVDHLEQYLTQTRDRLRDAAKAAKDAAAQVKAATELREKMGAGGRLVDDLDELRKVLRKFIDEVLARRSQALLAVAGQRLGEMTGGRYAFTEDFKVLDQLTGQPRAADTLSGGESFLASLSLALGMVDLAARAGGRVDALFLDEGFGALDHVNLSSAVDALEATSKEGRMVAVISHVRAVADRIEDVMLVLGDPKGSRVVWLDEAERTGISGEDVAAAMRGLLD